jgi:hypothetical protein
MLNRRTLKAMLVLASVAGFGPVAHAGLFTWGASGTGGSGTWNTTNTNWYDGTTNTAWVSGYDAAFGGTAGTVTLGSTITAGTLTFNTSGYTIAKGGYNLTATSLSGTGAVTFSGTGTASITGSSSGYSGAVTLGTGLDTTNVTLVGAGDSLGTGTVNLRGGLLGASTAGVTVANAMTVGGGGVRFGGSNSFTISGTITMDVASRTFANYSPNGSTVGLSGAIKF